VSEQIAKQFVAALHKLEQDRDLETIASLFAEDAEIDNVTTGARKEGEQGAKEFWLVYRETFDDMNSTFRNQIMTNGRAALEWVTSRRT
jgi:ketosteroid isomerase-like protein